jgi:hypothetical protein
MMHNFAKSLCFLSGPYGLNVPDCTTASFCGYSAAPRHQRYVGQLDIQPIM